MREPTEHSQAQIHDEKMRLNGVSRPKLINAVLQLQAEVKTLQAELDAAERQIARMQDIDHLERAVNEGCNLVELVCRKTGYTESLIEKERKRFRDAMLTGNGWSLWTT
ncbi:MAG: hypothetical protein GWN77_09270 [Gammaproteobacteria bacterium]|nr:hypothetical protein [Gammaproteobacteria bacterium]